MPRSPHPIFWQILKPDGCEYIYNLQKLHFFVKNQNCFLVYFLVIVVVVVFFNRLIPLHVINWQELDGCCLLSDEARIICHSQQR